MLQYW